MTLPNAARGIAALGGAAALGWISGSVAWALVLLLAAALAHLASGHRRFSLWSRHPLAPPQLRDSPWQRPANRLHRVIHAGRERSRGLLGALRRLRTTTDAIPDGWVIVRFDGQIETYNHAAQELLGLPADDDGQNLAELVRNPRIAALLKGEIESEIAEIASPADEARRIELRRIHMEQGRVLLIARDVTELNRLLTMRQDFIANVSHELRTPLTVIVGYLEELADDEIDYDTLRRMLPKLTPQARRMQALVDDLLTLTRLESAPLPDFDTIEVIKVAEMLETIVSEARRLARSDGHLTLEAEAALTMRGVSSELYSAFNNLVTNAVRYSPDGGPIRVRWFASAQGPRFEVEDSGLGIAPEHLSRLTERFYRIDLAGARVRGGTGLGLAIVKHVLRRHQSVLRVQSNLGKGSLFYCEFPRESLPARVPERVPDELGRRENRLSAWPGSSASRHP